MAGQPQLGSEFASWTSLPSISESFMKAAGGQFNPLMYAAGYALDKLGGSSDMSNKMMGQPAPQPVAPTAMGQGLTTQPSPAIPPNGGLGLASPGQGMFNYTPQTNVFSQPALGQAIGQQQQINPLDAWKNLSFNSLNRGQ
jgi:hypothetical protein